jgi:hypothetical protein
LPLLFLTFLLSFFIFFFNHSLSFSHTHIYFFLSFFSIHIFFFTLPSLDIFISLFKALYPSLYCIDTIWILK